MLDGGSNAGPFFGLDDSGCLSDDHGRIGRVASTQGTDRGVCGIQAEIDDGRQVEVDAGPGERDAGQDRGVGGVTKIIPSPEVGCRRRRRVAVVGIQPGDTTPLLVDGNEELGANRTLERRRAKLARQGGKLVWVRDVTAGAGGQLVSIEQDDPTELAGPDGHHDRLGRG